MTLITLVVQAPCIHNVSIKCHWLNEVFDNLRFVSLEQRRANRYDTVYANARNVLQCNLHM